MLVTDMDMITHAHAGVITKAAIQCAIRMPHEGTCLFALPSFQAVQQAHSLAKRLLPQSLAAFEFFDEASLRLALQHIPGAQNPFRAMHPMYVLLEIAGALMLISPPGSTLWCLVYVLADAGASRMLPRATKRESTGAGTDADQLQDSLVEFAGEAQDAQCVLDAAIAEDSTRVANLWRIREGISESLTKHGVTLPAVCRAVVVCGFIAGSLQPNCASLLLQAM